MVDEPVYTSYRSLYDANLYSVNGRVSKSFSWARTVVGLSGSASLGDYSYLSGSEVVDARTAEYAASADYSKSKLNFSSTSRGLKCVSV